MPHRGRRGRNLCNIGFGPNASLRTRLVAHVVTLCLLGAVLAAVYLLFPETDTYVWIATAVVGVIALALLVSGGVTAYRLHKQRQSAASMAPPAGAAAAGADDVPMSQRPSVATESLSVQYSGVPLAVAAHEPLAVYGASAPPGAYYGAPPPGAYYGAPPPPPPGAYYGAPSLPAAYGAPSLPAAYGAPAPAAAYGARAPPPMYADPYLPDSASPRVANPPSAYAYTYEPQPH